MSLGHVTIPALQTKFASSTLPAAALERDPVAVLLAMLSAPKPSSPPKKRSLFFSCQMSAMFRVLRALRKQKSVMRVCCFDARCPANLGTVRFLFGLVRFGLWFVSGFRAVLKTGSVNRFPVRFSTFLLFRLQSLWLPYRACVFIGVGANVGWFPSTNLGEEHAGFPETAVA